MGEAGMRLGMPIVRFLRLLGGFEGRIGRAAFWFGSGLVALALLALGEATRTLGPALAQPLIAFAGGFALYPWSALAAKRAADRGRPPLYGVGLVLGVVGLGLAAEGAPDPWRQALAFASTVFWLVALVDLGALPAAPAVAAIRGNAKPAR